VFFTLLFIFAIDFGNLVISIAAVGVLVMQLVGERITAYAGAPVKRPARPKLGSTLTYVIIDLGLFATLDIIGANPQSLPGLPLSVFGQGSLISAVSISSLFTIQIAIAEETFFRSGAANLGAKYGGPLLGILTSVVFFFAFHIPAYYNNPLGLAIVAADGGVLAWSDFDVGRLSPSMIAHLLNNLFFIVFASVILPSALGFKP